MQAWGQAMKGEGMGGLAWAGIRAPRRGPTIRARLQYSCSLLDTL